jgi:NAD(P)-dependent dehydrogenase (short-subunit alcohol dehydrogenase family)
VDAVTMQRRTVVTGSASGMGTATAALLRERGHQVIGIDLQDADVTADLSTPGGRETAVRGVTEQASGAIDALIHCAGIAAYTPLTIRVNYFGAVALLQGLRPLLAKGADPRAVVVTSYAATMTPDPQIIAAALAGDEDRAVELGAEAGVGNYTASKAALAQWCRAAAVSAEWAGSGILLNMVAPGMVHTPMIAHRLDTKEAFEAFKRQLPLPLDRPARAEELGELLAFLASPQNSYLVGQHIYADGGTEAFVRGQARF